MEEKKSPFDNIKGIFGGRPWILAIILVFIVILLLVCFLALVTAGKSNKKNQTVNPGQLTAAIVKGEDRFCYHDDEGNLTGVEPILAQRLAQAEGLVLNVIEADSADEAVSLLDAGAVDVAFGCISDEQNLTGKIVSASYANSGLFLVTALHDHTDSLTLMSGYSVGVLPNVKVTAQSITGYEFVSPKDYEDAAKLGEDIRDRVINMGIVCMRDAVKLVKSYPDALQAQEIANSPREYYVAVFPASGQARAVLFSGVINTPEVSEEEEAGAEATVK